MAIRKHSTLRNIPKLADSRRKQIICRDSTTLCDLINITVKHGRCDQHYRRNMVYLQWLNNKIMPLDGKKWLTPELKFKPYHRSVQNYISNTGN